MLFFDMPDDEQKSVTVNSPQDDALETAKLKRENEILSQQVKRLTRAEGKLYEYQEKLDAQLKEYQELYDLNKKLNATSDLGNIFRYAVEYIIHKLEYEKVLIFQQAEGNDDFAVRALDGYYSHEEKSSVSALTIKRNDALLSALHEDKEYLICKAGDENERLAGWRDKLLMDEYLIYPLVSARWPFGFLAVGNSIEKAGFYRRVNDDDEALLGVGNLVELLSSSIENYMYHTHMESALDQKMVAEEKYRSIFENALDGILQTSPDGRFLNCNPATAAILGYDSPDELVQSVPTIAQLYASPLRRRELYDLMEKKLDVKDFDVEMYRKDGSKRWVLVSTHPVFSEKGEMLYVDGIIQDITERKQAEEERLSHLEFLESLERIDQAIKQETDVKQMLRHAAKTVFSIFGCDRAWLLYPCDPGAPSFRVPVEIARPEYPGANIQNIDVPMSPDTAQDMLEALESDDPVTFIAGTERPVNKVSAELFGVQSQMFMPIYPKLGKPWIFGMHQCSYPRIWTKEEKNLLKEIGRRISDGLSSLLFLRDLQADIIEREKAEDALRILSEELEQRVIERTSQLQTANDELKSAQSRILQQEKMASIGQLAAGVAHEINNPVGFIMSNLRSLQKYSDRRSEFIRIQAAALRELSPDGDNEVLMRVTGQQKAMKLDYITEDIGNLISESIEGTERVKNIVQDLKGFSRVDEAEHKIADINAGLESTINIVWNELKYKATVKKDYGNIPQIKCNPGQLNQVFMNMLINAVHSIDKHGEITVRTWREGGYLKASIKDTGCGIQQEKLGRIFEPFYTTKDVGKGTGLGLSIAYDIIKKHDGEILVESEVGKGTTFTILIPITEESE